MRTCPLFLSASFVMCSNPVTFCLDDNHTMCDSGDRYDEEPRAGSGGGGGGGGGGRRMGDIGEWTDGRPKSMVGEALDKAKDLWNRVSDRRGPDKYD